MVAFDFVDKKTLDKCRPASLKRRACIIVMLTAFSGTYLDVVDAYLESAGGQKQLEYFVHSQKDGCSEIIEISLLH